MKNQLISNANFISSAKNTTYLIPGLWREKTTMLLHGPQNVDKTQKAIEIARYISESGKKIVYVNAADSLCDHADQLVGINNMSVLNPCFDGVEDSTDYADLVLNAIEETIAETDIRVFIIDSISRIAALSYGRNASAAYVMKRLVNLQLHSGCSFLIIYHDATKSADRALLNLATSENRIIEKSETSENSECSENTECSVLSECPSEATAASKQRKQLSRRERRILRRQAQKDVSKIS